MHGKVSTIVAFKRAGMCPGHPDLYFKWRDGNGITQFRYLEVKTMKGKLSENQKKWFTDFMLNQGSNEKAEVAYGYKPAIEILSEWTREIEE
jgi:hypothetical protein